MNSDPSHSLRDVLRAKLTGYDGKMTTFLDGLEPELSGEDGYLDALVALIGEDEGHFANGASWLLKSALQKGAALNEVQVDELASQLPKIKDWPTELHICQSIWLLGLREESTQRFADWLEGLLDHRRPFLRAWSLSALGALAEAHSKHGPAFEDALAQAREDGSASVRARVRMLTQPEP